MLSPFSGAVPRPVFRLPALPAEGRHLRRRDRGDGAAGDLSKKRGRVAPMGGLRQLPTGGNPQEKAASLSGLPSPASGSQPRTSPEVVVAEEAPPLIGPGELPSVAVLQAEQETPAPPATPHLGEQAVSAGLESGPTS